MADAWLMIGDEVNIPQKISEEISEELCEFIEDFYAFSKEDLQEATNGLTYPQYATQTLTSLIPSRSTATNTAIQVSASALYITGVALKLTSGAAWLTYKGTKTTAKAASKGAKALWEMSE